MEILSNKNRYYEFNGYLFYPEEKLVTKVQNNQKSWLFPKDAELLELFLTNSGEIMSNKEIAAKVWRTDNFKSASSNIRQSVHKIRQVIGDNLIITVLSEGYRFDGNVTAHNQSLSRSTCVKYRPSENFGGYNYFVVTQSFLYSSICVLSLFLEIGYKYEEFKYKAFLMAFPVFSISIGFMLGCFWLVYYLSIRKKSPNALIFGTILLAAATGAITALGCQILPDYPVTETIFPQSQTAQTAYAKDLCFYLLPIFSVAVLIPYGSVLMWKKEVHNGKHKEILRIMRNKFPKAVSKGSINFSVSLMLILLLTLFLYSTFTTLHLTDNLQHSPNRNLFSFLLWGRNFLYFTIAVVGIWWYSDSRKEITDSCLKFMRT
jgi:DNA-binding winged helix-turn-helix (wHTH) protein